MLKPNPTSKEVYQTHFNAVKKYEYRKINSSLSFSFLMALYVILLLSLFRLSTLWNNHSGSMNYSLRGSSVEGSKVCQVNYQNTDDKYPIGWLRQLNKIKAHWWKYYFLYLELIFLGGSSVDFTAQSFRADYFKTWLYY